MENGLFLFWQRIKPEETNDSFLSPSPSLNKHENHRSNLAKKKGHAFGEQR